MIKAKAFALMFIMSLSVGQAYAYNCSELVQYAGGNYSTGSLVKNANHAYRCTVGGWCTVGGPYEPGVGWAWQHAWEDLGSCDNTSSVPSSSSSTPSSSSSITSSSVPPSSSSSSTPVSSSSSSVASSTSSTGNCPSYAAGTSYQAGSVVTNAGGYYACTVAGWCSSGNAAYEPGVGWAYTSVPGHRPMQLPAAVQAPAVPMAIMFPMLASARKNLPAEKSTAREPMWPIKALCIAR